MKIKYRISNHVIFSFIWIDSKTNLGAIIGGTIGGVIALLLIALVVLFLVRRHKNGSKDGTLLFKLIFLIF